MSTPFLRGDQHKTYHASLAGLNNSKRRVRPTHIFVNVDQLYVTLFVHRTHPTLMD